VAGSGSKQKDFCAIRMRGCRGAWRLPHSARRNSFQADERKILADSSFPKASDHCAEFGVTGDDDFQQASLRAALQDMKNYPLLKAVAYLEAKDTPGAWGPNYITPDWRISPQFLASRR
jgi:hypothetical protein